MEEANTSTEGSLGIQFFFATPYHSWERGANENTNGLARQYIPKGSDFDLYSEENIAEIEWKLNHRLRKSLGYLTPLEYFKKSYNFDLGSRFTSILNSAFNLKKLENIGENGELCGQMP